MPALVASRTHSATPCRKTPSFRTDTKCLWIRAKPSPIRGGFSYLGHTWVTAEQGCTGQKGRTHPAGCAPPLLGTTVHPIVGHLAMIAWAFFKRPPAVLSCARARGCRLGLRRRTPQLSRPTG